jgi:hypothetical protein
VDERRALGLARRRQADAGADECSARHRKGLFGGVVGRAEMGENHLFEARVRDLGEQLSGFRIREMAGSAADALL